MGFHGCCDDVVDKILQGGFDPQRGGEKTGALFGYGAYIATNASKSDFYTDKKNIQKRTILICRAIVGNYFEAKKDKYRDLRKAPDEEKSGLSYDSLYAVPRADGGVVDHPEWVFYKESSILPMYKITYKHKANCKCRFCL